MDSLRYWFGEMGVDGFRFDLAATLGRQEGDFDPFSAFFDLVAQDPLISQAKLIAEPWDVGRLDSYDVGRFPPLWSEWNGRFRDTTRDWWRSQDRMLGDFASRLCGSADVYGGRGEGRRPSASVNFVTVHDGFTLADLVSYNGKHNEANGEGNRDGTDDNRSWNCGIEGPTTDPDVRALRARQQRAFLATLLLSAGVPMLSGRRRGRPHPAGQQQRVLPGQRRHLVRLVDDRPRLAVIHNRSHRVEAQSSGVPAPALPHRPRRCGLALVHRVGNGDDRPELGRSRGAQRRSLDRRLNGPRRRRRRRTAAR